MKTALKNTIGVVIGILLWVYMVGFMWFAAVFNYRYAHDHSFWNWVFLGEIAPTGKALVWPYYAFRAGPKKSSAPSGSGALSDDANRERFGTALAMMNEAEKASRAVMASASDKDADFSDIINYIEAASTSANAVDDSFLDAAHPDLKSHFRDEFCVGLREMLEGIRSKNRSRMALGATKADAFSAWFMKNREGFR